MRQNRTKVKKERKRTGRLQDEHAQIDVEGEAGDVKQKALNDVNEERCVSHRAAAEQCGLGQSRSAQVAGCSPAPC